MFAYCGNNPISRIDSTGTSFQTTFYPTCIDPGDGKRNDYVIYYYHPESSQNLDYPVTRNHVPAEAVYCSVRSFDELVDAINSTPAYTSDIFIYLHGDENNLSFYWDLNYNANHIQSLINDVDISGNIYLFSCKGGRGDLASTMAKATNCNVIACRYKVSFGSGYARYGYIDFWKYSSAWDEYAWYSFSPDGTMLPYSQYKILT